MLDKAKAVGTKIAQSDCAQQSINYLKDSAAYYKKNPSKGIRDGLLIGWGSWVGYSLDEMEEAAEISAYVDAMDHVGRHG